jgi:hypothetical protein
MSTPLATGAGHQPSADLWAILLKALIGERFSRGIHAKTVSRMIAAAQRLYPVRTSAPFSSGAG